MWISSYTNMAIGGYVTNGQIYYTDVCTEGISACQLMQVYVADNITANNWNYNSQGASGILGYGPRSPFWTAYTNTQGIAYSSAVLVPPTLGLGAAYDANEITFGSLGSYSTYTTSPLVINANVLQAQPVYDIDRFAFGVTYSDGSAYYSNFTSTNAAAQFTTSFDGMGLPSSLYKQYEQLVLNATLNMTTPAVCTNTTNGFCTLSQSCKSLSASISPFAFQVQFTGAANYINVPLSAFLVDTNGMCQINVVELTDNAAESSNVIFGANFYMTFFVAQQNTYALASGSEVITAQQLQIFVSLDNPYSAAYVGNAIYPLGPDPFAPISPTPPSPTPSSSDAGWIVALVIVILILAGFLGWAVWKWRSTSNQQDQIVYQENNAASEKKLIDQHRSAGNINSDDDEDV